MGEGKAKEESFSDYTVLYDLTPLCNSVDDIGLI